MKKGYFFNPVNLIGLIVIAVTLGVFFLLVPVRTGIYGWALFFLLLSEVVLFTGLSVMGRMKGEGNKIFMSSGASVILTIYFLLTLISCGISNLMKDRLHVFLTIEILIIALTAIILLVLASLAKGINQLEK